MQKWILEISVVGSLLIGGIIGGGINDMQREAEAVDQWGGILVLDGAGTLVANPAALTPGELANSTIIDPADHITICTSRSGDVFVNPREGECEDFKNIQSF